jgi:hypothetical protein
MRLLTFFTISLLLGVLASGAQAQNKPQSISTVKIEVYYFHPNERCPIDQSIEENTVKLMYGTYGKELKAGTIKFAVINTDDKSQAKTVERFDINAQALFVVKWTNGKEVKNDLTHFAFDYGQSNPDKFRTGLKVEIDKALKP